MKNILVPVEAHSAINSVLQTAVLASRRFSSYIEGTPLGPDLPDLVAFDMPVSWSVADQNTWKDMADEAHQRFEQAMRDAGLPEAGADKTATSFGWTGESAFGESQIGAYARIFDCTILGRPGTERGDARMATAETVLFESGKPIILAPPKTPEKMGETIVIAWNNSVETARASSMAMPLLKQASKVIVMTVEEFRSDGPAGDLYADMLCRHGVNAEFVIRSASHRNSGEAILRGAEALGGDLLIKGAYTQSRLRQMFFGGATSHIMNYAEIPVLMTS